MNENMTPEACIRKVLAKITKSEIWAFRGAILFGIMTHLYIFTNKMYNYDELVATPGSYGVAAQNNRWFLELMGKAASRFMAGSYSMPLWNGMLTLLVLTTAAMLVVRMFGCTNPVFSFFIGGFMTAFPTVVCMYFFMFTAFYYGCGIFLSVLAAYLLIKYPRKIVLNLVAIGLIACSIGTYQAYFANTVCLLLMFLILSCIKDEKKTWKQMVILAVRYAVILVAGLISYFLLNKFFLNCWNLSGGMGSYQGIDTMGQISLQDFWNGVKLCYQNFIALSYKEVLFLNSRSLQMKCFGVIFLLMAGSVAAIVIQKRESWQKNVLIVLGMLLFPISVFLVYIMAPEAYVYPLMVYSAVFIIVFMLLLIESCCMIYEKYNYRQAAVQWIAAGVSSVLLFFYIWYGNGNYMSMEYTKYHDLAYYETMITQIKSLEGFTDELPVAVLGRDIEDETSNMEDLCDDVFHMDGKSTSNINGPWNLYLITKYLGYAPEFCGYEENVAWMEKPEVIAMPSYPNDGAIQIIDGTIIVKISDFE